MYPIAIKISKLFVRQWLQFFEVIEPKIKGGINFYVHPISIVLEFLQNMLVIIVIQIVAISLKIF